MSAVGARHRNRGLVHGGQLSETQKQIERLAIEGVAHAEIGRRLGMKLWSVKRQLEKVRDVRAFERMRRTSVNEAPERGRDPQ